mmetsp:Transcript_25529/g.58957  ORF Transcript_25529/g.58957 Transcript_25529/m.58957 type:complete len:562 (-) Transcript_25529:57-1742(-)
MGHRIYERKHKCAYLVNLTTMYGSVFPSAFLISFPCALVSAILVFIFSDHPGSAEVNESILTNGAIWSSFSFIIGFLVVFRTSHSFNRFWEALTSTHKMGAEWFDACSALISFSKTNTCDGELVLLFHNTVIRLFSMLHACAIAELEDMDRGEDDDFMPQSFHILELLDARAFDDNTLLAIRESGCRVELIYQWIQQLIVENSKNGVLSIPAPILTRAFQELSTGFVCFHDAMKIADTPFPFPYAQTCDALLLVQYFCTPLVVATYVNHWGWAFLFCFVYIFSFWALTLTGLELEFPFGEDANDIDTVELQKSMNHKLQLLLTRSAWTAPKLQAGGLEQQKELINQICAAEEHVKPTFSRLWFDLEGSNELKSEQITSVKRRFAASSSGAVQAYVDPRTEREGTSVEVKVMMQPVNSKERNSRMPFRSSTKFIDGEDSFRAARSTNRSRPAPSRAHVQASYVCDGENSWNLNGCQSNCSDSYNGDRTGLHSDASRGSLGRRHSAGDADTVSNGNVSLAEKMTDSAPISLLRSVDEQPRANANAVEHPGLAKERESTTKTSL